MQASERSVHYSARWELVEIRLAWYELASRERRNMYWIRCSVQPPSADDRPVHFEVNRLLATLELPLLNVEASNLLDARHYVEPLLFPR
jgi:hypothetical protein